MRREEVMHARYHKVHRILTLPFSYYKVRSIKTFTYPNYAELMTAIRRITRTDSLEADHGVRKMKQDKV